MSRRKNALVTGALLAGLAALAACGGGSDTESGVVRFGVGDPQLQVGTAPYTSVPQEMGYFEDHGIDVKIQGTEGAVASVQGLLTGNFDIVNGGSTAFYQAAAKDDRIKVISLGADNVWRTVVPEDSDIQTIDDLAGKTVGSQSKSSASYLFGRAALSSSGIDPEKDVKWLEVGIGAQAAQALQAGQVDAYATYDGPLGVVEQLYGEPLRPLASPLDDLSGTLGIATTTEFLEEHPEEVAAFLRAFNEGKVFADANPEAAIRMHWKAYPSQAPKGDEDQAIQDTLPIVETRWAADAAPGSDGLIGYLDEKTLEDSIAFFVEHGLIDQAVPVEQIDGMDVTKEAAEDLDTDEIVKQAEEWTP